MFVLFGRLVYALARKLKKRAASFDDDENEFRTIVTKLNVNFSPIDFTSRAIFTGVGLWIEKRTVSNFILQ